MTEKSKMVFDSQLLHHIQAFENDKAKSLLNPDLCNAIDERWGSLLHYAALRGNAEIASHLITLGSDVDVLQSKRSSRTPLMTAVEYKQPIVVEVLLAANASIDLVPEDGDYSALEMAIGCCFDCTNVDVRILMAFFRRVQSDTTNVQQVIDRLVEAGCSMYHFAFLDNPKSIEVLLAHGGYDVDSPGPRGMTALHAAVELKNYDLVEWFVDKWGANVNVANNTGNSPLFFAALRGQVDILRFLLERGADPNGCLTAEMAPLYVVFSTSRPSTEAIYDECAELLLRHDALLTNPTDVRFTMLDHAILSLSYNKINMLLCRLAIVELSGGSSCIVESALRIRQNWHKTASSADIEDSYQKSREELEIAVFKKSTLIDLLTASEGEILKLARDKSFEPKMTDVFRERKLCETYPYYYRLAMERITKAIRIKTLQDMAVPAICNALQLQQDLYYLFAKGVVEYLSDPDLQLLCQVPN